MWSVRLRTLLATIGLIVTLGVFVSIPCGYFYLQYAAKSHELTYKAEMAASSVAKFVYLHPALWQYQTARIAEIIEITETDGDDYILSVHNEVGAVVAGAGTAAMLAPTMVRSHPIVISGAIIGRVDASSSLRPQLWRTGFSVLISAVFGIGIYFAVRVFPLVVLDRTLGALEIAKETIQDKNKTLQVQNEHLDAALTNMSQGLCMFGVDERLEIFNPRFAEIYRLPPEKISRGMTPADLMALAFSGELGSADSEGTLALQRSLVREGKAGAIVEHLTDGRSISILIRPMPDGRFVATFEDITERLLAEEKIKRLAHYDALTDLPNRVTFYERMEAVMGRLRRSESIVILSLDLDHFKSVNDTLGHPIGDRLLQTASQRMRGCIRAGDTVARLGGDEFAILQVLSDPSPDVAAFAARLIEVVGAPYEFDGRQVIVGVSVGIAIAPSGGEPDVLMKNADLALYRAKADGGGVYRFFEPEMDARMQARRVIELDLRKAIMNGEFELYYQPIVSVKTGQIACCEALIRWHHPERGLISPLDFIPVAEATGLIIPLGEWVFRQACAEAARWPEHVTVAVNVSPTQFKSSNLVPTVVNALAASGLPADRLELEITELVLIQDDDGAFATLHQFHDLGIKIAMDDFGTGYSSLGYLRNFPFDKIKIDQSFVQDLPEKADSVAIIRAVVALGSSLGITTTAEGVETKEQFASLTAEGCDEMQGFLFSRPRPAGEMLKILGEQPARTAAVA